MKIVTEMGSGMLAVLFPFFSRRGGCAINKKIPFLIGADGVVGKFKRNKERYADIYKDASRPFTNHPAAARPPPL